MVMICTCTFSSCARNLSEIVAFFQIEDCVSLDFIAAGTYSAIMSWWLYFQISEAVLLMYAFMTARTSEECTRLIITWRHAESWCRAFPFFCFSYHTQFRDFSLNYLIISSWEPNENQLVEKQFVREFLRRISMPSQKFFCVILLTNSSKRAEQRWVGWLLKAGYGNTFSSFKQGFLKYSFSGLIQSVTN